MKTNRAAKTSAPKSAKPAKPVKVEYVTHTVNGSVDWINGECPVCGVQGPHESNGEKVTSYGYSICCKACGHQESPNEG